jgi:beta-aspartyl-peptidase (threonine type)
MKPSIIVHGGAWDIPSETVDAHIIGCKRAVEAGFDILAKGGSAVDAVENAVANLEDDPTFDAGRGSVLNQVGQVEMDAIVMDGRTLRSGAVAAIRHVRNPVRVARRVMDATPFSLLTGDGALRFALRSGFKECTEEDLLVGRELEDYREFLRTGVLRTKEEFAGESRDTVGACAMDREGHLACATSTGGISRKLPGRVGDSPLIGSGAYADDNAGAASATGWGEKIMAIVLSKTAVDFLSVEGEPNAACRKAIAIMSERVDGYGGLIMIDKSGRVGYHHNTPKMAFAFVDNQLMRVHAGIEK